MFTLSLRSWSLAACNLINNDMKQFIISSETDDIREVEDKVVAFMGFKFLSYLSSEFLWNHRNV